MKLYYAPGTCSMACHIAAVEGGLTLTLSKVDLRAGTTETGAAFRSINSKGYVPALEVQDGFTLTETTAILLYIAELCEDGRLAPTPKTMARYKFMEWLGFIATEIHKPFGTFYQPDATEQAKSSAMAALQRRFAFLEAHFSSNEFLMGARHTVVDSYAFTVLSWSRMVGLDLALFPKLAAYLRRMGERAAVQFAMAREGLLD